MAVKIYHNPRCSKSRKTLQLLQDNGVEPEVIEYLKNPPEPSEIKKLLKLLGCNARDLMRKNENAFKELNLKDQSLTEDILIDAMYKNPILIERPVVVANGKAVIGRPPESVLEII